MKGTLLMATTAGSEDFLMREIEPQPLPPITADSLAVLRETVSGTRPDPGEARELAVPGHGGVRRGRSVAA